MIAQWTTIITKTIYRKRPNPLKQKTLSYKRAQEYVAFCRITLVLREKANRIRYENGFILLFNHKTGYCAMGDLNDD